MWKLSIVDDSGEATVVNLVRDEYTVGRSEANTIRLTEQNISRTHCLIRRTQLGYRVEDKASYNGVFVNGVRVVGGQDLAHRDVVQLGDYRIEVVDEALDTQEQSHRPFPDLLPPASGRLPDRLVVLIGPYQGHEFPLHAERHLLGRGEECDIQLDHASVSRVHAEVRRIGDQRFEVVDKASANGLRVNGHELPRALLDSRDVVELGDVVLKYIPKGQVFHAGPLEGERIATLGGSLPPPTKAPPPNLRTSIIAAAIGALAAGVFGILYLRSAAPATKVFGVKGATAATDGAPTPATDPSLVRALALLRQGAFREAHQVAQSLPSTSTDRKSAEYFAIEDAWAREILRTAEREPDRATRRSLLDQVARADGVSLELRNRAMQTMDSGNDAIDLSDLGKNAKSR